MQIRYLIPLFIFLADRFTKVWAQRALSAVPQGVVLWPGVVRLYYIQNTGMAFGMLPGQRWLLVALSFAALIFAIIALRPYRLGRWAEVCLLVILGGMAGNLTDRLLFGHVVDMIDFTFVRFAIINVADIAISLGAVFLCISLLFRPNDWLRKGEQQKKA